jgi:hypothetical protein
MVVSLSDRHTAGESVDRGARGVPAWPAWLFRIVVTAEAVLAFNQAVFAGRFINGDYGAVATHSTGAAVTGLVLLVEAVAAVLLWRPGRGPGWPIPAALGLFLLVGVQIALGFTRALAVHVPLGVTIIVLDTLMLVWAWRYRPAGRPAGRAARRAARREGAADDPAPADAGATVGER